MPAPAALPDFPKRKRTTLLVVHVTATRRSSKYGRAELERDHKARGFAAIGYNRFINLDGTPEIGRGDAAIGAHVEGYNSITWGISIVGGLDENGKPANTMTPAQEATLIAELRAALVLYPDARICGHRDLSKDLDGDGMIEPSEWTKMCPCFDVIPWANANGLPGAHIRGAWDPKAPAAPDAPDTREIYLQRLLAKAGFYKNAIDGLIGPKTKAALEAFQKANGLPVTGTFDPKTIARLEGK